MDNKSFTVTLCDEKILLLLEHLHSLNLLKLTPNVTKKSKEKVSFEKYSGILSREEGEKMQKEIQKSRDEWDRRISY